MNGEDSSQRRFYFKALTPLLEEKKKNNKELIEKEREELKKINIKADVETEETYTKRIDILLNSNSALIAKLQEKSFFEVELTDKTITVLQKYVNEFEKKNGWTMGDDALIEEIEKAFTSTK